MIPELVKRLCDSSLIPDDFFRNQALKALADIIDLTPRVVRIWDPDTYTTTMLPAVSAVDIMDILKRRNMLEGA